MTRRGPGAVIVGTPRRGRVASGRAKRARWPARRGPRAAVATTRRRGRVAPGRARRARRTVRRTKWAEDVAAPRRFRVTSWRTRRGAQRPPWRRAWLARRETEWASRSAHRRPAASTARRERSAHRVRGGAMPTVQVPSSAGSNRAPLLVGVPRVATCTVTTIDGPRLLKSMRPPSIVAIAKAGGVRRSPLPRVRHGRWRGGRGGGMHVEMVTGALAGTGRGGREEGGVKVPLGASPPRVVGTLPARHGRRAGRS